MSISIACQKMLVCLFVHACNDVCGLMESCDLLLCTFFSHVILIL